MPSVLTIDWWEFSSFTACDKESLFYAVSCTSGRVVTHQASPRSEAPHYEFFTPNL